MGKTVVAVVWLNPNQNTSLYPGILDDFKIGKRLSRPSAEYFFLDSEGEAQSLKNHLGKNIPVQAYRLVRDPGNQPVLDSAGKHVAVREPSIEIIEDDPRRSPPPVDVDDYETHIKLRNQVPE